MVKQGDTFTLDSDTAAGDATRVHLPHPEILQADAARPVASARRRQGAPDRAREATARGSSPASRSAASCPTARASACRKPCCPSPRWRRKTAPISKPRSMPASTGSRSPSSSGPEDIAEAKKIARGRASVMSKIEKPQAVTRLDEIMEISDSLMVARGDLGVELPLEKVPGIQKQITRAARRAGKPVVVATQMLESMITSPVPTRAEVSDVATAIFEGADAIMLSAESAAGQYPVEAVATMDRIAQEVESDPTYRTIIEGQRAEPEATGADAIAAATRQIAETLDLSAIICWTSSGSTALARRARTPGAADCRDLAQPLDRAEIVAGLGRALRRRGRRARPGRHGGARLPDRIQGRLRQGRPPRHHRRGRAARNAGRDQHGAHRLCRIGSRRADTNSRAQPPAHAQPPLRSDAAGRDAACDRRPRRISSRASGIAAVSARAWISSDTVRSRSPVITTVGTRMSR